MHRKVLITALMLGVSMVGFSQTNEIKNVNPEVLAKTVVENSQKELLDKMSRRLKDRNEPNVKFDKKMTEAQQFLYQEDLIDSVLKAKSHLLKDVYGKLCDKSNMPTELIYEGININNIAYKEFETGKKQGQVDSTTFIVPVLFQAHTIAKDGVSDVKYAITFNWAVKVKAETEKTVADGKKTTHIIGYVQNGAPTLVSSIAHPIKYLTSDKKDMKTAVQNAIVEWYANLPQTLDKQYAEQSVSAIKTMNVSSNDIVFNLPESQSFTITEVPAIKVDIDPYQFISDEDKSLYTEPAAYIIVAPVFNVSIDDSFKNADLSVSYVVKETVKPIADKEKELRRSAANSVIAELIKQLSTYVTSRDAEQKAVIENMFDTAESDVEVSHLPKRGLEKIKKESAQKYLSLLKGASLNFSIDNIKVVNPNWDSLIYTVSQEYRSKTYSDYTQKRIYLTYDATKGTYVINKIEVVPNSTKIE